MTPNNVTNPIGIVLFKRFYGMDKEGALLEGKGIALAEIRDAVTETWEVEFLLDGLRLIDISSARPLVISQAVTEIFHQGPCRLRSTGNVRKHRR